MQLGSEELKLSNRSLMRTEESFWEASAHMGQSVPRASESLPCQYPLQVRFQALLVNSRHIQRDLAKSHKTELIRTNLLIQLMATFHNTELSPFPP